MSLYRIDELFNFEKGSLQSSKCEAGEYNFITASADWKTHKEFTYDREALVFAAAAAGSLGRTHYVNDKFIASDLCFILTPKDAENFPIDLKFYHLIFRELRKDIVKNTKAGTSKEAISLGSFARYKLPYFDIEKQNEIKNRFVEAEATKESFSNGLEYQLALVKELRQAYLREAMQGKLVPQDSTDEAAEILLEKIKAEKEKLVAEKRIKRDKPLPPINAEETPFKIPSNWTWCRLGELAEVVRGGSPRPAGDKRFYDGEIPFLKVGDLTAIDEIYLNSHTYTIKEAGLNKTRMVEADTLMLTNSGATLGIPKICTFQTTFNDGIAAFLNLVFMDKKFLYYFLKSKSQWYLETASRGQGQPNLNTDIIANTPLSLPPLAEQERIVAKLEMLMKFCDELEANIREGIKNADQLLQTALKEALESKEG